jgi:hypothetical protein
VFLGQIENEAPAYVDTEWLKGLTLGERVEQLRCGGLKSYKVLMFRPFLDVPESQAVIFACKNFIEIQNPPGHSELAYLITSGRFGKFLDARHWMFEQQSREEWQEAGRDAFPKIKELLRGFGKPVGE